jgi:hypothetical protein
MKTKDSRALTLQDIKDRCVVDDFTDCWNWKGAISHGKHSRIWAVDYTRGGKLAAQPGKRAVWHIINQRALPNGWRVYSNCANTLCLNPDHISAGSTELWGRAVTRNGVHKNSVARKIAAKRRQGAHTTLDQFSQAEIRRRSANETGLSLAREFGVSKSLVSRIIRGETSSSAAMGIFSGLIK